MSDIEFELNRAGVRELMKSAQMQEIVSSYANSARSRLGDGYGTDTYVGRTRVNAMVYADSVPAKIENSRSNSLLKAVQK